MLFDAGESRASLIPESHIGFPGGISGPALLGALRKQTATYGVRQISARVTELKRERVGFAATFSEQEIKGAVYPARNRHRRRKPRPARSRQRGCQGFDTLLSCLRRIRIVLGHGDDASGKAKFLRTYSSDVTLLSLDDRGSRDTETVRSLREAGIKVAGPVGAIEYSGDGMRAVLRRGQTLSFDVVYPALGCGVRSELATSLGAKTNNVGCLEVDSHQRTTVPGIYAAGDVVSDLHQIAVASGHAAIAATHIHKSLPENFKGTEDAVDPAAA